MSRVLSALRPLAAFSAFNQSPEDRVRRLFLETTADTGERIDALLALAGVLDTELDAIQEALGNIKKQAMAEIGDLPTRDTLRALWVLLAMPDDKEYLHRPHELQLTDLVSLYKAASDVVRDTTAVLLHARAELQECSDGDIDPVLLLQKHPLDVMAARIRGSVQRLDACKRSLQGGGGGGTRTADIVMGGTTHAYRA